MTKKFLNNIDLNGTLTIAGSGGTNGYFLSTNGSGSISWAAAASSYTLPTATSTVFGGIKLFSDTAQTVAATAVSATASRTYGVQLNASSQAVVNIPWTDTVYTLPSGPSDATTSTATSGFGFMGLPQNATTTGSYTIVAADAGKHIYASATRTVTIPANSSVAFPVGTTITFIAGLSATLTIAITTDTMYLANSGNTGSRTLAATGMATAIKIASTTWIISGNGLT
jgi:hypothetical protein